MERRNFLKKLGIGAAITTGAVLLNSSVAAANSMKDTAKKNDPAFWDTYFVREDCINCGTCYDVCEHDAVIQGLLTHLIDPDICIGCGICQPQCPVDMIGKGRQW